VKGRERLMAGTNATPPYTHWLTTGVLRGKQQQTLVQKRQLQQLRVYAATTRHQAILFWDGWPCTMTSLGPWSGREHGLCWADDVNTISKNTTPQGLLWTWQAIYFNSRWAVWKSNATHKPGVMGL
jgi:hypothetical protein